MANEIGVTSRLTYSANGLNVTKTFSGNDDQATFGRVQNVASLSTTAAALDTAGVSDPAWFQIHNLDATQTVNWGLSAGSTPFEVPPNTANQVKLETGSTVYAKTGSGTTYAEVIFCER